MRAILIVLIVGSLGCGGSGTDSGSTTFSGTFQLSEIDRSTTPPPCYTVDDPALAPDRSVAHLVRGTLTFNVDGTASLAAVYHFLRESNSAFVSEADSTYSLTYVRAGSSLLIKYKGVTGNGAIQPGEFSFWTIQPWCTGLIDASETQRFDFTR
jgi:hypothetical protein